jgi:hypothetical protein
MQHPPESIAAPAAAQDATPPKPLPEVSAEAPAAELALDGVRYADLPGAGDRAWRLGSCTPLWRQELPLTAGEPDAATLSALEEKGVWLAPADAPPPLAVMCCGLGSVWPGMGRELYDQAPAARAMMDRIAAVAGWDVLALMDETDVEKISRTRWQSPYLFMVELAQWSVLESLGLTPALFCGHSLGELIALCLAGIYSPEVGWYILDTRAATHGRAGGPPRGGHGHDGRARGALRHRRSLRRLAGPLYFQLQYAAPVYSERPAPRAAGGPQKPAQAAHPGHAP